jgi:hypothetical protein
MIFPRCRAGSVSHRERRDSRNSASGPNRTPARRVHGYGATAAMIIAFAGVVIYAMIAAAG